MNANQLIEHFERDGYLLLPNVLDRDLMHEARQHLAWLIEGHPDIRPEKLSSLFQEVDPFWLRLVGDTRLLDIAEQFIGPDIALFGAHYLCKPAGDGKAVLWHQDGHYWPLEPMEVVTLWLAVDDVTVANGCMRVIPGSHRMAFQAHAERDPNSVLEIGIDPKLLDESSAVDCVLESGGIEVHHPNTIHASNANHSPRRRAGLAIRYIPTSTRITQQPWPGAFLLRGKPVPGINDYWARPRFDAGRHFPFRGCESWT